VEIAIDSKIVIINTLNYLTRGNHMFDKLRPSRDKILIKRVEEEELTAGGIIRPDTAKQKGQKGVVVAAGPGKLDNNGNRVPLSVVAGDIVFFGKYAGTELDDQHLIVGEEDVLGVIEK